jgi:uncharacterized protein with HEPN domain
MKGSDRQRLEDVLEFAERAIRIAGDLAMAQVVANEEKYYAIRYCLQVVGECVKDLSRETTAKMPGVPWSEIRAMRNRLAHGYRAISGEVVFDTVKLDLPALIQAVRRYLSAHPEEGE